MSTRQPGEHHDLLLLKLKTVEPLIKCQEEKLSQLELDVMKAMALHPFDPAEQALFLSRAEIRPGEFTPSHSLIVADLEQAARCLGDEYAEEKKRASEVFWGRHLAVAVLIRQEAGPEVSGAFMVEFLRASAALIRVGLQPALHLRGRLLDLLKHPEPVTPPGEVTGQGVPVRAGDNANVFRLDGKDWSVRYRHSKLLPVRFNAGSAYVHYLLERPRRTVPVAELAAYWDRIQMPDRHPTSAREAEANRSGNDGPVLDALTLREVGEEVDRIEDGLREAEANNDTALAAKLRGERQYLAQEVARARKPGGRLAAVADQQKRLTNRVTRAISRTIESMQEKCPTLGQHLGGAITTGAMCMYAPESPTHWEL